MLSCVFLPPPDDSVTAQIVKCFPTVVGVYPNALTAAAGFALVLQPFRRLLQEIVCTPVQHAYLREHLHVLFVVPVCAPCARSPHIGVASGEC